MDRRALAVLAAAESWDRPISHRTQSESGGQASKYKAPAAKLLSCCIRESRPAYPDSTLLENFWQNFRECHTGFRMNIQRLDTLPGSVPQEESVRVLFQDINRDNVNFTPIFEMADELFTHLGIAFQNPGGPKLGGGTPYSVSEFVSKNTDELVREAAQQGFGMRKQEVLKALSFKRDGNKCILTGSPFYPMDPDGVDPILSHIIPDSIHNKPHTLECIGMLAGTKVWDIVVKNLNEIGNVMNLQWDAQAAYRDIRCAIQANVMDDGKIIYTFRKLLREDSLGPGCIQLRHGDAISFGSGQAEELGSGPSPVLCNLQYVVARILCMSGAAEVIAQLKYDADDSDIPYTELASTDFINILTAKLLLNSGQVLY
ncbi:hypothetical protein PILCRDRAFT_826234 [Piloderma croceum F 1598]|uniref:HNH nuclease domain-containing protein n=1 Tax=Piloderma croceum (strain F 1598) TaxID=765440 RepID=A0A0C3EVA4_PILCF|nr:hypothetical protein PILCRDRAFT_826234 [Piloderma croceum F 1598]